MRPRRAPSRIPRRRERGSALVVVLVISAVLGLLGLTFLTLGEAEALQARSRLERQRSEEAAREVVRVAAAWLDPAATAPRPGADLWSRDRRRGDLDGDGSDDPSCDGSRAGGRLEIAPEALALAAPGRPAETTCGRPETPDLLLEGAPFLLALGEALGPGVTVERIAVSAPRRVRGARHGVATVSATVSLRRGRLVVARRHASVSVVRVPALDGPELLHAGGNVVVEPGARVLWGAVVGQRDVLLPSPEQAGFPWSGLPRQADGRTPLDFRPGGVVDWNLGTARREYVLTELLGGTQRGLLVDTSSATPPALPDPWVSVRAGRTIRLGRRDACPREGVRQPFPYDPRRVDVVDDLSHLTCHLDPGAAVPAGDVAALVATQETAVAGSRRVRRYYLAPGGSGEPRWAEMGSGPARTAAEWLADDVQEGVRATFLAAGAPVPETVHVAAGAGIVVVEARRVVLVDAGRLRLEPVALPGEPWLDEGIDADRDGRVDAPTVGNGAWDADVDGDGGADADPPPATAWVLADAHADVLPGWPPDDDREARHLESAPHEPFLNLAYPEDVGSLAVRVDYLAGAGRPSVAAGVRDLPGEPGRRTTASRDAVGGRLLRPLHFRGLIVNPVGDVEIEAGHVLHGAVRAAGDVIVRAGAEASFDSGLAREGRPAAMDLPTLAATDFDTWTGERAPGHEEGGGARGGDEAEDGEPASGVRRPTGRSVDGAPDPRRDRAGAGGRVRPRAG